jgi:hypothetical protein
MYGRFKKGEVAYERTHPRQKLVITRYIGGLYYGKAQEHAHQKELAFFERELKTNAAFGNP